MRCYEKRRIPCREVFVEIWNHQAVELVLELGRRMAAVTEDTREATYTVAYLFQRLSEAIQRGNAVSFTTE